MTNHELYEFMADIKALLDCIDYTNGACRLNEPIGGILPIDILSNVKNKIKEYIP